MLGIKSKKKIGFFSQNVPFQVTTFFCLVLIQSTQILLVVLKCVTFVFLLKYFFQFETVAMITEIVSFPPLS